MVSQLSLKKDQFYTARHEDMEDSYLLHLGDDSQTCSCPSPPLPLQSGPLPSSPVLSSYPASVPEFKHLLSLLTSDPQVKSHHLFHTVPSERSLMGHMWNLGALGEFLMPSPISLTQSTLCAFLHFGNHSKHKHIIYTLQHCIE